MTASRRTLRSTFLVVLSEIALAALLALLSVAWIHIPDANAFELLLSLLLALLIAILAGVGQSLIALRLSDHSATARRLLLGTSVVITATLLWYVISLGYDRLATHTYEWAGYLNSRFPAPMRRFFSYEHIDLWLTWILNLLPWITAALLAAPAFAMIASKAPLQAIFISLRSWRYWTSLLLLAIIAAPVTSALLSWTPGHGLGTEIISLVLRVIVVVVLNALAIALLLQSLAGAALRAQSAGIGDPETTQPRIAETP